MENRTFQRTSREDRGESITLMEPVKLSETSRHRPELADMALELVAQSAAFRSRLPENFLVPLSNLVRSMNCYYSNLIEGHNTHPVDIERALNNDFSREPEQRNLQLEARAHIVVQQWLDKGALAEKEITCEAIATIHRIFSEQLPKEWLEVVYPNSGKKERLIPGAFRHVDVKIGQHVPVSPGAIPRFLDRLESAYSSLGTAESLINAAIFHHRLLWIHPFLDGNGRVTRLLSHALLGRILDSRGIWSIARGLARNVQTYRQHLAGCDQPRRNDLDGRGHLSEENLAAFSRFFLETCLDQVSFMSQLMKPDTLQQRIMTWVRQTPSLSPHCQIIMESVLYRGQIHRHELPNLLGIGDRQCRRVVNDLIQAGVLINENQRAPLLLAFPARLASQWMPGLFPEKSEG